MNKGYYDKYINGQENNMDNKDNRIAIEILQDLFTTYVCFKTQEKIKNPFVQELYGYTMVYFYSVFLHELFQANLIDNNTNCENIKKLVKGFRQRFLKQEALVNGKLTNKIINEMGLDFQHFVYDLVLTTDKKDQSILYSINFGLWDLEHIEKDKVELFNANAQVPEILIKKLLYDFGSKEEIDILIEKFEDVCEKIAAEVETEIQPIKYPYSSGILFVNNELSEQDKVLILFYYSYFLLFIIVEDLVPPLKFEIGEISIDIKHSLMKLKAMLIANFGENIMDMNTPMVNNLKSKIDKSFGESNVFQLNRRLRNNIHYNETKYISEEEWITIDVFQREYQNIVIRQFRESIRFKFGKRYRLIKWIADHTDTTMIEQKRNAKKEAKKNKLTTTKI